MSETSETFSYTLSRTIDAPVEKVWHAWTTADAYAQWAYAVPGSVTLDVRPGGAWQATMRSPDGSEFPISGAYTEVVENKRLVVGMEIPGRSEPALMALDLDAKGDQTTVKLSQTCDTAEERDMAEQGSNMLLDGLTSFLASA